MNQPAIVKDFQEDTGSIVVKPLSPALGAEIVGIDLREEPSAHTVAAILDAWHQHLVIVFRDQKLTEDE